MELIPDWAPNVHPLIVHFPIAFLVGAIGADLLSLTFRRWTWLRPATVALYIAGGTSAVLTYVTGTWAANSVTVAAEAQSVLTEHANLGWQVMWFFGAYALLRLGAHLWPRTRASRSTQGVLLVMALGGAVLLYETGEHGAEMVYRYGVGVRQAEEGETAGEPGLTVGETGWQWRPRLASAWTDRMRWLEGTPDTLEARLDTLDDGSVALALTPEAPGTFIVPDTLGAVQVTAKLDRSAFDGSVSLLHHVQDLRSYDFLQLSGAMLRQGRVQDGTTTVFAEAERIADRWEAIRVVGDGTHF
ncbi:putative membrane protein [Salinibacter ruber]|jgi:uncharacterized membrane protein|uniref:DUF2231 domain-containing protein n=1 Tax=Salinibacter ruber TaxID=146919 RepID=UPI002169C0FD|nr:DUF2231 domain-containing protein [Salinibacter ruber]MCS3936978.1 putative membrane protein [Salinibacter ruber]MCS4047601.1 putative membrane protein [Salinibacter ruber]